MITEGSKVTYAGEDPFQDVGSIGKVVSAAGTYSHVMWESGPKGGMIEVVDNDDLLPYRDKPVTARRTTVADGFDSTLDMPGMPVLAVRSTYDEDGEEGLVTALNEAGRLAVLAEYAEEALSHIATRVRQDPAIAEVLAQLEPDEADSLVGRVSSLVLMDRMED